MTSLCTYQILIFIITIVLLNNFYKNSMLNNKENTYLYQLISKIENSANFTIVRFSNLFRPTELIIF